MNCHNKPPTLPTFHRRRGADDKEYTNMKVIILNGSPRKGWNTDLLLKEAEKAQGMPEQKLSTSIFMI